MGGPVAALAQPVVDARLPRGSFRVLPCADRERLASLSAACRDPDRITGLRSTDHLAGRYGAHPFPDLPHAHLMMDGGKDVDWHALLESRRGTRDQIRSGMLVDLMWLGGHGAPAAILKEVVAVSRSRSDLLCLRARALLGDAPSALGAGLRRPARPTTYLFGKEPDSAGRFPNRFDFVPADGDTAM